MRGDRKLGVSVIIPTYQEERYLSTLLLRLVRVRYPIEIVVVDGDSPDKTVEIAKSFATKVYTVKQRGIAKARNYGALQSEGDILIFLDTDVTPPLDFVEQTLETFQDNMVVAATCSIVPAQPRPIETVFFSFYNRLLRLCAAFRPHSRGEFLAVRRKHFLEAGGFDERLPCIEDHDFAFRVSRLGRFVFMSGLTVAESMRRIRKLGMLRVAKMWVINYVSYVLFRRTVSKVWKAVR